MAEKLAELEAKAKGLGIELTGTETKAELSEKISSFVPPPPPGGVLEGDNGTQNISESSNAPQAEGGAPEKTFVMTQSAIEKLIADTVARTKGEEIPMRAKRVKEHMAHVWRFDGKWVVDFVDQNNDPYVKEKVHSFNVFNEQERQWIAWLELKFDDGSTKKVPLWTYIKNRVLVYCTIIKRERVDISYSIGMVDKKKEVGDMMVPSGVMIPQEVEMYQDTFVVKTPDGIELTLPAYVIA